MPYTTLIINPIIPTPWRAPYTLPLGRTTLILNPPCHSPNPSPLSFPPPSMTVHGPTWCRGRLRLTGLRALYSPNDWDDFGLLFGVCDDALWALLNTPARGVLRDRPEFPAPASLGTNANPAARDVFKTRHGLHGCLARMLSIFLCCDPRKHRRYKSPCYCGSQHRHPSSLPARHHHCYDVAPRDDDGCRGRCVAYTPEEKAHRNLRPPRSHPGVQRNPWPTSNSRPSSSSA